MITVLLYFLGASILLTLAPGPDNIFIVTQGITRGKQAAMITACGMCSGISVHTLGAALGISAIFHTSEHAFQLVKFAGAAYLIYLAYQAIRSKEHSPATISTHTGTQAWACFRRGFIMNVLNPKVALFFLAFLPQFATLAIGPIALQMFVLGLLFMVQAFVIFLTIAYFSGVIGQVILGKPSVSRCFNWIAATIYVSLGLRLALAQR